MTIGSVSCGARPTFPVVALTPPSAPAPAVQSSPAASISSGGNGRGGSFDVRA